MTAGDMNKFDTKTPFIPMHKQLLYNKVTVDTVALLYSNYAIPSIPYL